MGSTQYEMSDTDSDTEHNRLMAERVLDYSDGNAAANPGDEDAMLAEVNGGPMAMLMQRNQSSSAQPRKRHIAREPSEDGELRDESPNVSARQPPARSQAKKAKEPQQLHPLSIRYQLRRVSGLASPQRHDHLRPPVVPMNSGGVDRSRNSNNNNPANPNGTQRATFWHTPAREKHQPALNNGVGTSSRARQPNRQQPAAVPDANENIGPKTPPTEPPAPNRRRALSTGETSSSAHGAGNTKRARLSANANDSNGEPQAAVVANNGENVLRDAIRHARRVLDSVEREHEQLDEEAVDVSENGDIENGPNVFDLPPPASPDTDEPHFFFQDHDYNLFRRRSAEGIEELLDQRQLNVRTFNRYPQRQSNVRPIAPQHEEENQEGFVCRCVYVDDDNRTPRRMQPRNRDIHGRSNSRERGNDGDWQTPAGRGRQPYRERRFPSTAPTFNQYSRFDRSGSRPANSRFDRSGTRPPVQHTRPGRSESRPANSRFDRSASRPPMQQHNRFGRALSNESVFDERNNWSTHGNRGSFVSPQRANHWMPAVPRNLPFRRHNDNIVVNNNARTPRFPNPNPALPNRRPNHFAAYPANGNSGDRVGRQNAPRNAYAPNPSRTFPSPNRPLNIGAAPKRNNWTGNRDRIRQPVAAGNENEKTASRFFFGGPVFTQPAERVRPRPSPYNPPVGRGNMNNRFGPRREFGANAAGHHNRNPPRLQQPFVRAAHNRIGFRHGGGQRAGPSGVGFNRGNPWIGRRQDDWNFDELEQHFG